MSLTFDIVGYKESTRMVMFEKNQSYYFKLDPKGACEKRCHLLLNGTRVGSGACGRCMFNKGYGPTEKYIVCSKLKEALTEKN